MKIVPTYLIVVRCLYMCMFSPNKHFLCRGEYSLSPPKHQKVPPRKMYPMYPKRIYIYTYSHRRRHNACLCFHAPSYLGAKIMHTASCVRTIYGKFCMCCLEAIVRPASHGHLQDVAECASGTCLRRIL